MAVRSMLCATAAVLLFAMQDASGYLAGAPPRLGGLRQSASHRSSSSFWGANVHTMATASAGGAIHGAAGATRRRQGPRMAFGWEGYQDSSKKESGMVGVFPRWAVVGSWRLDWEDIDGEKASWLVNLNEDGSVAPPEVNEKEGKDGSARFSGEWRMEEERVSVKIIQCVSRTVGGMSVLSFEGSMLDLQGRPYGSQAAGNVVEGEVDPEYAGKYNMTQVVGGAAMGIAPGRPAPVQSRASKDFSVTARSSQEVLSRFAGMWDGHIKMEDTHGHVKVELFPNGSFVTRDYQRFTDNGINKDGVLRGRWNVYYSDTTDTDRFWMQILRLKCSGMSLWSDLLLIGDLSPVHTFNDIEGILQKQISNATAGTDEKEGVDESDDQTKLEDMGVFTAASNDGEEDDVDGGEKGARGRLGSMGGGDGGVEKRRYNAHGAVIFGHSFEPAVIGGFQLRSRGEDTDEGSEFWGEGGGMGGGMAEGWESDFGLGGDEL